MRRRVVLESPYAGDVRGNIAYATSCMRQPAPLLDDLVPGEREMGMDAGFAWIYAAEASVVYTDRGISDGMRQGIELAERCGLKVEYRKLGGV